MSSISITLEDKGKWDKISIILTNTETVGADTDESLLVVSEVLDIKIQKWMVTNFIFSLLVTNTIMIFPTMSFSNTSSVCYIKCISAVLQIAWKTDSKKWQRNLCRFWAAEKYLTSSDAVQHAEFMSLAAG